jgi:hypothetical protein
MIASKPFHFKPHIKMTKAKRNPPAAKPKPMNAREHLFAFTGILMQRKASIICDQEHNAAAIGELANAYADANKLPAFRDDCRKAKWPEGTDHITNVQKNFTTELIDKEVAQAKIMGLLEFLSRADQNAVMGKILQTMKRRLQASADHAEEKHQDAYKHERQVNDTLRDLENIMAGNFTVL